MTNILLLSLAGFPSSARQLYPTLFPKLLARAAVHESITIADALVWIHARWPHVILISDATVAAPSCEAQQLLAAIRHSTKLSGTTACFMGVSAAEIAPEALTALFKEHFDLQWEAAPEFSSAATRYLTYGSTENDIAVQLANPDHNTIRMENLVAYPFTPEALFLKHVPVRDAVYYGSVQGHILCYAAIGRTGMGKLGYVGDFIQSEEAERFILAVACLDRSVADVSRGVFHASWSRPNVSREWSMASVEADVESRDDLESEQE